MSRPPTEREIWQLAYAIMEIIDRVPVPVFLKGDHILIWQNPREST